MKILVIGGTRLIGPYLVDSLLEKGHDVTIATRGKKKDRFGKSVKRIRIERMDPKSLLEAFRNKTFDALCDNLAYASNDIRNLLEAVNCGRYVMISSAYAYKNLHPSTKEEEFDPFSYPLSWLDEADVSYDEGKRLAESALFQKYGNIPSVAVRFPYVIGENDYTQRLYSYVENVIKGIPMNIDNLEEQLGFISSKEAGEFLAWIIEEEYTGPINSSSIGTISVQEILDYVEGKTGKKALISVKGKYGAYNGQKSFSLDIARARNLGFGFNELKPWIYSLLDTYLKMIKGLK